MKLSAIASRGLARDFWDCHALLERGVADGDLSRALELFQTKFTSQDTGHLLKSLVYFADAEAAPLPTGLSPERWHEIKDAMVRRVRAID